jgi:hypothetical protein
MAAKMTYSDVRTLQDSIPKSGMQGHYVLGAYEVMFADLVADLPKHKQAEYRSAMERLAERARQINP